MRSTPFVLLATVALLAATLPPATSAKPVAGEDASPSLAMLADRAATLVADEWGPGASLVEVVNTVPRDASGLTKDLGELHPVAWRFVHAIPGSAALGMVTFRADGSLANAIHHESAQEVARLATARPLPAAGLDAERLVAALSTAASKLGMDPANLDLVKYTYGAAKEKPGEAAWEVELIGSAKQAVVRVDPLLWTTETEARPSPSDETGTKTSQPALSVEGVYGARSNAGGSPSPTIDNLTVMVGVRAGAAPIAVGKLAVRYSNGTTVRHLTRSVATAEHVWGSDGAEGYADRFRLEVLRDDDGSFEGEHPMLTPGDLVKLTVYRVRLPVRVPVTLTLLPESGPTVPADFTTPPTFGTRLNVVLR